MSTSLSAHNGCGSLFSQWSSDGHSPVVCPPNAVTSPQIKKKRYGVTSRTVTSHQKSKSQRAAASGKNFKIRGPAPRLVMERCKNEFRDLALLNGHCLFRTSNDAINQRIRSDVPFFFDSYHLQHNEIPRALAFEAAPNNLIWSELPAAAALPVAEESKLDLSVNSLDCQSATSFDIVSIAEKSDKAHDWIEVTDPTNDSEEWDVVDDEKYFTEEEFSLFVPTYSEVVQFSKEWTLSAAPPFRPNMTKKKKSSNLALSSKIFEEEMSDAECNSWIIDQSFLETKSQTSISYHRHIRRKRKDYAKRKGL